MNPTSQRRRMGMLWMGRIPPEATDASGGDYPELFRRLLEPVGFEVVPYAVDEGELPGSARDCDAWITSGSAESVFDDLAWLPAARDLVRDIVAAEVPYVGVCFGHQLLAQAHGGSVVRATGAGWGVGVQHYRIIEPRAWMDPPAEDLALVASHQDQVSELPPDAVRLATSEHCPEAAFALGERAIGVQAHPEFPVALSARLLELRADRIGAPTVARARATLTEPAHSERFASWISAFVGA